MNEILGLLQNSATRLLADRWNDQALRDAGEVWPAALWDALQQLGLPSVLRSQENGGAALTFGEGLALVRTIGAHGTPLPLPLPETMLAAYLLDQAGIAVPDGPLTIGPVAPGDAVRFDRRADGWSVSGTLRRVPWARNVRYIAIAGQSEGGEAIALVSLEGAAVRHGLNLAAEPRDDVTFDAAPTVALALREDAVAVLLAHGAALRATQIAAACATVLAMAMDHANTRMQFGRAIGKFQAVQQNLAIMAGHAAAAAGGADLVAHAPADKYLLGPAIAKARAGAAAGAVAALAHQTFAAMGYAEEHALHRLTKRLLSWRDECGAERYWAARIGREAFARGGDHLWRLVSGT